MFRMLDDSSEHYVQVEVTRSIRVGRTLRINPSESYLGIEPGVIQVTHILWPADIAAAKEQGVQQDIISQIDTFRDAELDNHDSTEHGGVYTYVQESMDNHPWVVYKYTNGEVAVLPLEWFIDHTMHY